MGHEAPRTRTRQVGRGLGEGAEVADAVGAVPLGAGAGNLLGTLRAGAHGCKVGFRLFWLRTRARRRRGREEAAHLKSFPTQMTKEKSKRPHAGCWHQIR